MSTPVLQGIETTLLNLLAPCVKPQGQLSAIIVEPFGSVADLSDAIKRASERTPIPLAVLSMGGTASFGGGQVSNTPAAQVSASFAYTLALVFSDYKMQGDRAGIIYQATEDIMTAISDRDLAGSEVAPGWSAYRVAFTQSTTFRDSESNIYGILFSFNVNCRRRVSPLGARVP